MPHIEKITVHGFKSINSIEQLALMPINVIIGPNGSGKSNFIGVFSFLNAIREERLETYVIKSGGANKILHFGIKNTQEVFIHVYFSNEVNQYSIKLVATDEDELIPAKEFTYFWNKNRYSGPVGLGLSRNGKEAGISKLEQDKVAEFVQHHLSRWRVYHFHDTSSASPMKTTSSINDNRFLRNDGGNLSSFLYFLRNKHPNSYEVIRRTIQRVAPFFEDFVLEPQKLNPNNIRLEWRHKNSDDYFDASSFSDGTLRFIALTTLFMQPAEYRTSVILVDEPELGLHPYAISLLASMIKQASLSTQVIISTQSPLLLDNFEPKDVLVAERNNGGTTFTRLENSSELQEWLAEYSLGELWEKNELGGRPKVE